MAYALGVTIFAVGILVSVCLHEAGHMGTAKAFGMKVTRYFVGFGPTLWSFRRGETEYGVKAIPAGGFVKIIGMTPLEEEAEVTDPADRHRVFWRKPLWQRTVVLAAGSATHLILAFVILWVVVVFLGVPDPSRIGSSPPVVGYVAPCQALEWEYDERTGAPRECDPEHDPPSAAAQLGLQRGDVITGFDGQRVETFDELVALVEAAGGRRVEVTYQRDGTEYVGEVAIPLVETIREDVGPIPADQVNESHLEREGKLGITGRAPMVTVGPLAGITETASMIGDMVVRTFQALAAFPQRVPDLIQALAGGERDPETPVSVVGASRLGGELVQYEEWSSFLVLLAVFNLFVGIFNLLPLLPLDGGHIAIAWFERIRSWVYARRGRPDPGRVDYMKLMPITYAVIIIFGAFALLTIAADIINPIELFSR